MASNAGDITRWFFGLVGVANLTISIRERLIREDKDVLEILGSVVSLHSIYLASIVVSSIIVIACAFPALEWAWKIPARREELQQKKSLERIRNVLEKITQLKGALDSFNIYVRRTSEENTTILIFKTI